MSLIINPYILKSSEAASTDLEWNPNVLGTSVVRALYNPYGDNDSVTLTASDVDQVDDLSGNGFNLTPSTSPNFNAGTIEIDHTNSEDLTVVLDAGTAVGSGHLFVYAELGSGNNFGRFIGIPGENDANQSDYATPLVNVSGNLVIYENNTQILSTPQPTGFNLIEVRFESGDTSYWFNGSEVATVNSGHNMNFEGIGFGRGWTNSQAASINWRVACFIEGTLSTDERQRLEGWMMQQVDDKSSLPSGHTYKNTNFVDPTFVLSSYDIAWEYKAVQTAWTTYEPGDGSKYFISSPNLNTAHVGSANGDEVYSNTGTGGADTGKGWTIEDADKGIKLTSAGEESIKTRLYDGSSELGLRHDIGDFFELVVVTFNNGYGPGNNFRKDNGNASSKWEGGSKWKHEDIFAANNDGTGATFNDNVTMSFDTTVDGNSGKTYLFAHTRDMASSQLHPSINADVPGTHADGPKYIQWIQEVTAEGIWSPAINDTLNESILQNNKTYDFSPAYIHATAPDIDNSGNNTHEYYWNEGTVLHMFVYGKKVLTNEELQGAYEYAKNFL